MSIEDEDEPTEAEVLAEEAERMEAHASYLNRVAEANARGLDKAWMVRLRVPKKLEHLIPDINVPEVVQVVFVSSACNKIAMLEKLTETYAPMEVRWIYPIGDTPKLPTTLE